MINLMRAHLPSKAGVTLTELLIATILIGIVMTGITAFSFSVKEFESTSSKTNLMAMQVAAAANLISRDAHRAVGDPTNKGIRHSYAANLESLCFRHDNRANQTPDVYTDDEWTCYFRDANGDVWRCFPDTANLATGTCNTNNAAHLYRAALAYPVGIYPSQFGIYQPAGTIDYVYMALDTRFDPQSEWHPIDNPGYHLSLTVNPVAHSR